MAVSLQIRFDRLSRTFRPGEAVTGRLLLTSRSAIKHDGVELTLEGLVGRGSLTVTIDQVSTQKNAALLDNLAYVNSSKPTVLLSRPARPPHPSPRPEPLPHQGRQAGRRHRGAALLGGAQVTRHPGHSCLWQAGPGPRPGGDLPWPPHLRHLHRQVLLLLLDLPTDLPRCELKRSLLQQNVVTSEEVGAARRLTARPRSMSRSPMMRARRTSSQRRQSSR
jgi:hypothetical protein